jgi:lysophospholipase L1-like esterase
MRRVFVYGDSNVYGDNRTTNIRVAYDQRWVQLLQKLVDGKFEVVSNGVSGRIAGDYRADKPDRNGKDDFITKYDKAGVVDILVIALGTNDLQDKFQRSVDNILNDLSWYQTVASSARVVYLLPANFDTSEEAGPEFNERAQLLRRELIENKERLGNTIVMSDVALSDGLHYSPRGHEAVAKVVAETLERFDG